MPKLFEQEFKLCPFKVHVKAQMLLLCCPSPTSKYLSWALAICVHFFQVFFVLFFLILKGNLQQKQLAANAVLKTEQVK